MILKPSTLIATLALLLGSILSKSANNRIPLSHKPLTVTGLERLRYDLMDKQSKFLESPL